MCLGKATKVGGRKLFSRSEPNRSEIRSGGSENTVRSSFGGRFLGGKLVCRKKQFLEGFQSPRNPDPEGELLFSSDLSKDGSICVNQGCH